MPTFISMMRILFSVIALGTIAGCDLAERDTSACESYGFSPGTEAFGNCLMERDQTRKQSMADALRSSGDNFNSTPARTCSTYVSAHGSTVQTRCY
ncbi:hypothetical protein [Roseivivax jejudonensis]|uniref:hypothetical protein n=1 Tax=Roseivivax jejudonensis TaxID=1529041 RepID=UPI00117B96FF|nr:hypothetical protein [Roseivivax jejudonensis]